MSYLSSLSAFNAVERYAKCGMRVFPCHTLEGSVCSCGNANCGDVGKHPLLSNGVHGATSDHADLQRYFTGDYASANVAIATGEESGIIVLDVDSDADLAALLAANGQSLPKTWSVQTGSGGRHLYFRYDERCRNVKNAVKFAGSLDVRTDGGYVIAPPSVHKSGKRYAWIVSPDDCELASLPDWLYSIMPKREALAAVGTESDNQQRTTQPKTITSVRPTSPISQDSQTPNGSPLTIRRATTPLERAILYLDSVPPAISGSGGMNHTFKVCCYLCRSFDSLSDDELLTALQRWNSRCVPAWKENDLRRKIADARKRVIVKTAKKESDESEQHESWDVADTASTLNEAAYHGIIGEIAKAIEPETEADTAGVLLSLLTCFGNACGRSATFSVGGDDHHANLFAFIVGDTSAGKGIALANALYVMKRVDPTWHEESLAYGLASGEGLIERIADDVINAAESAGVDATKQPLRIVSAPQAKNLLCVETEANKPITAMRREGSTLSAVIRQAWDARPLEVMTRGRTRLRASNAYVSIIAHITPAELRKLLGGSVETLNGFANRFLWCNVRSSKDLPSGGKLSVVDPLCDTLRRRLAMAKTIGMMTRTSGAESLWNDVYRSLKDGSGTGTERGRPQVLRLAMLYALADGLSTIDERHLQAALAVWRYCEESAMTLFAESEPLAVKIRSIVRKNAGVLRSEIRSAISHSIDTPTFDSALRWLMQRGDIVCIPCFDKRQEERYYAGMGYKGRRPETETGTESAVSPASLDSESNTDNAASPASRNPLTSAEAKTETAAPTDTIITEPQAMTAETQSQQTKAMTLAELIDWRNANGIRFVRSSDGSICVSDDQRHLLTPSIAEAMRHNQSTLAIFAEEPYHEVTIEEIFGELDDESWMDDLRYPPADNNDKRPVFEYRMAT